MPRKIFYQRSIMRALHEPSPARQSIKMKKIDFSISHIIKYLPYLMITTHPCAVRFFTSCKSLIIYLTVLSLCNCSALDLPLSLIHGSLETQIEALFRRQNQASGQVMMLLIEDESSSMLDKLEHAEQLMLDACKPLNKYAVLERDNQKISLAQKQRARHSIHPCTTETQKLEILLNKYFSGERT